MLRRLALSYWTPIVAGLVLLGLHLAWAIRWESTKRGEAVTGFGACLIVLGLLVAARPYIRAGRRGMAETQVQAPQFTPLMDSGGRIIREAHETYNLKVEAVMPDIVAERVIAVGVIAVGTLFNGYGSPLIRWLGLEG